MNNDLNSAQHSALSQVCRVHNIVHYHRSVVCTTQCTITGLSCAQCACSRAVSCALEALCRDTASNQANLVETCSTVATQGQKGLCRDRETSVVTLVAQSPPKPCHDTKILSRHRVMCLCRVRVALLRVRVPIAHAGLPRAHRLGRVPNLRALS